MKIIRNRRCHAKMVIIVIATALMGSLTEAGFRPVKTQNARTDSARVTMDAYKKSTKPVDSSSLSRVSIYRKGDVLNIENRSGVTDQVDLDPDESVTVEVTRPGLRPGTRAYVFTLHGGRINGNLTDSIVVSEEGVLSFVFTANKWFGNYPVVMRINGRDEEIGFWVNRQEESK